MLELQLSFDCGVQNSVNKFSGKSTELDEQLI